MTEYNRAELDMMLAKERAAVDAEDVRQYDELTHVQNELLLSQEDDQADAEKISQLRATVLELKAQLAGFTHHTLIGCSQPDNVWGHRPECVRMFFSAGQKPVTMNLTNVPTGAMLILSRKERGDWFWQLLDNIRRERPDLIIVVTAGIHEPEDDIEAKKLTLDQYRAWCEEDDILINQRGYISAQVLMGFSIRKRDWRSYIVDSVDHLWLDVYQPAAGVRPPAYADPAVWLKPFFDAQAVVGKPMGFAEFAFRPRLEDESNPDDPEYLAAIKANRDYCQGREELVAACWYNSHGAPAEFTTQARADAWLP